MKIMKSVLTAVLFAIFAVFTSCTKEEVVDPKPLINFKGGTTYTSSDVSIKMNQSILVGINASQNSATKKKLTNFKIIITANSTPTTLINETLTENQQTVFTKDYNISFNSVGVATLTARITDSDNVSAEVSFVVTITPAGVTVRKKSNVELGSFNDALGSFYATTTETVYTIPLAAQNQSKVDLVYFKGATNLNTIAAPDDADAQTITSYQLNTWTTKNQTRFFKTTLTPTVFDAIGTTYDFPVYTATATKITQLAVGDIVYYRTQAGKRGLIKVVNLFSRGDVGKFDVIAEQ